MNTVINKLKTSLLIGALFVVGSALADPEPLFAKADDIPGNQQVMTNTQEYVDAKVDSIPAPDFTVSNDTLVATIEATAPAPGNYAAVSNAAMNALSRAEVEAGFSEWIVTSPLTTNPLKLMWDSLGWTVYEYFDEGFGPEWSPSSNQKGYADSTSLEWYGDGDSRYPYSATRVRLPTMTDLDGKASTNDIHLVSVYGKWICNPKHIPAEDLIEEMQSFAPNGITPYVAYANAAGEEITLGGSQIPTWMAVRPYPFTVEWNEEGERLPYDPEAMSITTFSRITGRSFTASRTIIGYTLGSQTNKPIASTDAVAAVRAVADAAATTNAAQTAALASQASQLSQQSQSISTLGSQVSAIGAHLNAEDARFVSTNYNSATHMPEAYVEVKITENGESSWLTVWREMTRWDWFLGIYTNQYAELSAALANKGEREYAFYDGVTGEPAPDGFFWIAQPRVAVAAGMSYQRYVDTGGAVWVLESNGMVADVNGTTNGFFRISDDEGNTQFEIVKGSSRTVVAAPGAMTHESVMGVTHWFTTYAVTNAASAPVAMFCRDIASPEWHAETDGDCPCNVSWTNPESGVYVCEWWAKGTEPRMFMKSEYGQGTESRIVQTAPVEMQYIVINGVKYTLGTATISGNTVLTLSPAAP